MPRTKFAVARSCCFTQARPLYQTLRQPTEQEKALPGPDGKFGRYCFQPGGRWASKHLPACTELAPTKRDIAAVGGAVSDGAAKKAKNAEAGDDDDDDDDAAAEAAATEEAATEAAE